MFLFQTVSPHHQISQQSINLQLSPSSKDISYMHRPTNSSTRVLLRVTHSPVLLERSRTSDRRLISACRLEDIICSAVGCDGTFLCGGGRGVVGAVGFGDVVLDEGVGGPAVDREVGVSGGSVGSVVVDDSVLCCQTLLLDDDRKGDYRSLDPGFHPFPPTRLPEFPDHWRLYVPASSLV